MKRFLVALMVLAVVSSGPSACSLRPKATNGGKVLTIYVWNDEFQTRFKDYFEKAGLVPAGVTVNWVVTPNQDNAYQNKLDEALLAQDKAAANDKIDIFLVEADYALKYVNTAFHPRRHQGRRPRPGRRVPDVQVHQGHHDRLQGRPQGRFLAGLPRRPHLSPLHRQGRPRHR